METIFLENDYVALSLIKSKEKIFHEKFVTFSELGQFEHFLQQEFNNQELDIVITSNGLSSSDFKIVGDVIMPVDNCSLNINLVPFRALKVLNDSNLLTDFFEQFENERLEAIEKSKVKNLQLRKVKNNI